MSHYCVIPKGWTSEKLNVEKSMFLHFEIISSRMTTGAPLRRRDRFVSRFSKNARNGAHKRELVV
jgi:hypothetical protein